MRLQNFNFFYYLGSAVAASDSHPLPDLDIFNLSSGNTSSNAGAAKKLEEPEEEVEDNLPLFYQ